MAAAQAGTSRGTLWKTKRAGRRATGDMHARPKCTMASARWCAAATSSTQHDPKVVSARTKKRTPLGASTSTLAPSLHRRVSAAATATASCSNSSGICNATRAWPPARTQAAVASSSYTSFRCADSSDISAVCLASPRVRAQRERPLRGNPSTLGELEGAKVRKWSSRIGARLDFRTRLCHSNVLISPSSMLRARRLTRNRCHHDIESPISPSQILLASSPSRGLHSSITLHPTAFPDALAPLVSLPLCVRILRTSAGGSRWRLFARSQRSMRDRPRAGPNFCEDCGVSVRSQRGCLGRRATFTARFIHPPRRGGRVGERDRPAGFEVRGHAPRSCRTS